MRKGLIANLAIPAAVLAVLLVPLVAGAQGKTSNMFIASDTDSYDKGLPIGATFPPLKAQYQGKVVRDLRPFIRDKGMIFIANRSADW